MWLIMNTSALIVQSHDDRGVIVLIVMGLICFSFYLERSFRKNVTRPRDGHVGLINS